MGHRAKTKFWAVAGVSGALLFAPPLADAQQAVDTSPVAGAEKAIGTTGGNQSKPVTVPAVAPMDNATITAEHVAALIARARSNHAKGDYDSARGDSSEA